jgi:hypothetical protein
LIAYINYSQIAILLVVMMISTNFNITSLSSIMKVVISLLSIIRSFRLSYRFLKSIRSNAYLVFYVSVSAKRFITSTKVRERRFRSNRLSLSFFFILATTTILSIAYCTIYSTSKLLLKNSWVLFIEYSLLNKLYSVF